MVVGEGGHSTGVLLYYVFANVEAMSITISPFFSLRIIYIIGIVQSGELYSHDNRKNVDERRDYEI